MLSSEQKHELAHKRDLKLCHNCGILNLSTFCEYCIETAEARGEVRRLRHIECSPYCQGRGKNSRELNFTFSKSKSPAPKQKVVLPLGS
jgi:hypothetical protein